MVEDDELWYYHGDRESISLPENPDFEDTVDPDLKPLVEFLHLRRIPTTPSCSGHFPDEDHFKKIWRKLTLEKDLIRTKGLPLEDVETGEKVLFKDPEYELPWEAFSEFFTKKSEHAKGGYLGMWVRDPVLKERLRHILTGPSKFNYFREVGNLDQATLFALGVRQNDEDAQRKKWEEWTKRIKQAFLGLY